MSKVLVYGVLLALAAGSGWAQGGKERKPQVLMSWHFAGSDQISSNKELKTLPQIIALPESKALRTAAVQRFTQMAATRFLRGKAVETNSGPQITNALNNLLPDLFSAETKFELGTVDGRTTDWIFALKTADDRAAEWGKQVLELAKLSGMKTTPNSAAGDWTADSDKESYGLAFSRVNGWVVLQGGHSPRKATEKAVKDFRSSLGKRRGKEVLRAEVNSSLLAEVFPNVHWLSHAPKLLLTAAPRNESVRTEIELEYPKALEIQPEKWNAPTASIREPLVGFTALQGIREKLAESKQLRALQLQKTPNQLFLWSQDNTPFSIYMAAEVGDPVQVVTNFATRVLPTLKMLTNFSGNFQYSTNQSGLFWRGLPVIVPFMEPASAPNSSFLLAGFFPARGEPGEPAPAELFAQLKKKNLIYYDWEITQPRLQQWKPLWQLKHILPGYLLPLSDAPSEKWLEAIAPLLGNNTVTEVTLEGARKLKLVRSSHSGFNALELVALAHWLDPNDLRALPYRNQLPAAPATPSP
jgi:hypothetical protein